MPDDDALGVAMTPNALAKCCRAASQPLSPLAVTQLYLNCQRFTAITEAIARYPAAESLWLERNRIRVVEHIDKLKELKTVFLHGNYIESVGTCFQALRHLRVLTLSSNRLTCVSHMPPAAIAA